MMNDNKYFVIFILSLMFLTLIIYKIYLYNLSKSKIDLPYEDEIGKLLKHDINKYD